MQTLDVDTLALEIHESHVELFKEEGKEPPPFDEPHYRKIAAGLLDGSITEESLLKSVEKPASGE